MADELEQVNEQLKDHTTIRRLWSELVRELIITYEPESVESLLNGARKVAADLTYAHSTFVRGARRRQASSKTPEAAQKYEELLSSYFAGAVELTRGYYQSMLALRAQTASYLIFWDDARKLEQQIHEAGPPLEIPGKTRPAGPGERVGG